MHKRLRRRYGAVAMATLVGLVAAACGDDDDTTSPATSAAAVSTTAAGPTTTAAPQFDPNGVIKIGRALAATGQPMDPTKVTNQGLQYVNALVYDTLLYDDGVNLRLGLANRVDIINKQQLEIELPANAKFTDGTPLDAEAFKFSLERAFASNARTAFDLILFQAFDNVVVKSPTVATINLKQPVAGAFRAMLARGEGMIVSPTAVKAGVDLATKPVGGGPFVLDKYDVNSSVVFKKNPNYVKADQVKIAGIEFVNVAGSAASTNALRAGTVDMITGVDAATAATLNAKPLTTIQLVTGNQYVTLSLCLTQPPLNNLQVRQALNYAIDRDAINRVLFEGKGELVTSLWQKASPNYNNVSTFTFDQRKARDLLAAAGATNLNLKVVADTSNAQSARLFEIFQQQYKDVGVTLTLVPTTNIAVDFFNTGNPSNRKGDAASLVTSFVGINRLRPFVAGAQANACNYTDPTLEALAAEVRGADPGSRASIDALQKFSQLSFDQALAVFGVWSSVAVAHHEKVSVTLMVDPVGQVQLDPLKSFVKK